MCIQISQEAGRVVWYSHLFKNSPDFVVVHTVKGFVIVNKAEVDVFLELSCFLNDRTDVGNLNVKVMCPLHIVKKPMETLKDISETLSYSIENCGKFFKRWGYQSTLPAS